MHPYKVSESSILVSTPFPAEGQQIHSQNKIHGPCTMLIIIIILPSPIKVSEQVYLATNRSLHDHILNLSHLVVPVLAVIVSATYLYFRAL